jgi:hypothetical protein
MKYYRSLALAASLAAGLALPASAQTAAPRPDTTTPMPDAGVSKAAPTPVKHTHHAAHHTAKPTTPPAKL